MTVKDRQLLDDLEHERKELDRQIAVLEDAKEHVNQRIDELKEKAMYQNNWGN